MSAGKKTEPVTAGNGYSPTGKPQRRVGESQTGFVSSYSQRLARWKTISRRDWNDWRWQMRNAIRSVEDLKTTVNLSPEGAAEIARVEKVYPIIITPHYLSLADTGDPQDPIWLQAVPRLAEISSSHHLAEDPLAEEDLSPVPGLIHRYPDRALIVATEMCPVYCRHCFRKRLFRADQPAALAPNFAQMIAYLRTAKKVKEVILSGGDPLMLSDQRLEHLISALRGIKHIEIIRIHTRVPVALPQRLFSRNLLEILRHYGPIWMVTHFNHPRELTAESARAVNLVLKAGVPVNNQSVLLKGVNDNVETMKELLRGLLRLKCRPYYLHHCDPVRGAGHFRTSIWKGMEIMEALRGRISGLAIPTYVVDAPGGYGKIPLAPKFIVSTEENAVVLRTYEGKRIRYESEGEASPQNDGARDAKWG
jgi:lysine 2,3-aminomutase